MKTRKMASSKGIVDLCSNSKDKESETNVVDEKEGECGEDEELLLRDPLNLHMYNDLSDEDDDEEEEEGEDNEMKIGGIEEIPGQKIAAASANMLTSQQVCDWTSNHTSDDNGV